MSTYKRLLIIIVTYNGMQWIERCLRSVAESSYPADVIVIDNGSTDGTQDYIRNNFSNAEFIQSKKNLGFGAANNIGFRKAIKEGYDYIYLLNQDAWVEKNTFQILIEEVEKNVEYGIISPVQVNSSKKVLDNNFYNSVLTRNIVSDRLFCENDASLYEVDFVMAAHWLITIECLIAVGGFSPIFKHYGEDDDFIYRAKGKGFKIGVSFSTVGVHDREDRPVMSKSKERYFQRVIFLKEAAKRGMTKSLFWEDFKSCVRLAFSQRSFRSFSNLFYILKNWNAINKVVLLYQEGITPFLS